MTRAELRERFRTENPEVTARALPDALLDDWMFDADKEISAETFCIVSNELEVIESVAETQFYDLESEIDKFYEINDLSGGGVYYNNVPLVKTTAAEMNRISRSWRSRTSGTPKRYFRQGKYLWFDRKPDTSDVDISVDCFLISDDFNSDEASPYNSLGHLEPFHTGVLKYVQFKAKQKLGKPEEAKMAYQEYAEYKLDMKKKVSKYTKGAIYMKPTDR